MKKEIIFISLAILLLGISISFVNSDEGSDARILEKKGEQIRDAVKEKIQNEEQREKIIREFKDTVRQKNGTLRIRGETFRVNLNESEKEIIKGKIKARTKLNLTTEENESLGQLLRAILSNGNFADIKIMPDAAALSALKRIKAKCEEGTCRVELKEVGGKEKKVVYTIETEKEGRLFFLFKTKMKVQADVDSETGEVLRVKKPWWSFVIKEKDEISDDLESETKLEVKGNVELTPSIKNSISKIIDSLNNTEEKVRIRIRVEKEDNIAISYTEKNGTISDNVKSILDDLERDLRALVNSTQGNVKLTIKITHKLHDLEDKDDDIKKVVLCHKTSSVSQTLTVARASIKAHLAHGDRLGECKPGETGNGTNNNQTNTNNTNNTNTQVNVTVQITESFGLDDTN